MNRGRCLPRWKMRPPLVSDQRQSSPPYLEIEMEILSLLLFLASVYGLYKLIQYIDAKKEENRKP